MWSIDNVRSFCINLDRRPDRWTDVQMQPESKKFNMTRVSAVDGKTLTLDDPRMSVLCRYNIKQKSRRSHDLLDTIGGVGCALSHIALWQSLVSSKENVYLILEDDVLIPDKTWTSIQFLFNKYSFLADSTSWDIWSIGNTACGQTIGAPRETRPSVDKWIQCNEFVGLQAYFISRTGAQKLLKDVFPIQHHIDWFITFYTQMKPFKIIHNTLVNCGQKGVDSNIQKKDERCIICDIPTNVEPSYIIPHHQLQVGLLVILASACVLWLTNRR